MSETRDTTRPSGETKEQRRERRRSAALREMRDAIAERFTALGNDIAFLALDTKQLREGVHDIKQALTIQTAMNETILTNQARMERKLDRVLELLEGRGEKTPLETPRVER